MLKTRAVAQYPFDLFYGEFWNELAAAHRLVAGGYGWRDAPVNAVIRAWLLGRSDAPRVLEIRGPAEQRDRALSALSLDEEGTSRVGHYELSLPAPAAISSLASRLSPPD